MTKDLKYIIKRIIIGVGIIFVLSFINKCDVNAQNTAYNIYVNNTLMTPSTKKYVGNNQNVSVLIRGAGNVNNSMPLYGYVALCSAFGSYDNRYINTASSSAMSDIAIVNSTRGCTIPTTSDYKNTARVVYFTFTIKPTQWDCGSGNLCFLRDTTFAWYQPASNEYALVSYGFNALSYNFNNEVDPAIQQNQQIIDQNNTQINQNNQIINQNTQINDNIQENTDAMKDSKVDSPRGDINNVKGKVASNTTISSLVTMPVRLFTNVLNGLNTSCATFTLGTMFGKTLEFQCINLNDVLGSFLFNTIDVIISGLLVYAISRKFIKLFNELSQMKEGDIID